MNKAIDAARQLYEVVWSTGKIRILNEIMAEDHVQRDMVWQPDNTGGGRSRLKRGILAFRQSYPDLRFEVHDVAASEETGKVFVAWTASGTNLGPIREQPPTGKAVHFSGLALLTFNEAGQIQESMVYRQAPVDELTYFSRAAGFAPAPVSQPSEATESMAH